MTIVQKEEEKLGKKEIEEVISRAIKKVGARKENDICKYLPMKTGGYMHHFTLKKMKNKQPGMLSEIIQEYVIKAERPSVIPPKQRAPRGSRKRRDALNFTGVQLEKMLNLARMTGDKEIINLLSPRKSLAACKKELLQSIRREKIEVELWNRYVEVITAHNALSASTSAN
ncbi:MAG: hypothetical protein KGI80_05435 [Verrucomicrobiota bacterium]|nr:hypothetical protein [Verrucomicrobiota bacterium]